MKKCLLFLVIPLFFAFPVFALNKGFFSFSSPDTLPTVGKTFNIDLTLNTDGSDVKRADAVITFDPAKLTVVTLTPGAIFTSYPVKEFSGGTIRLSGEMQPATASFSGIGKFGTITFKGKSAGTTTISFSCTPGETNESNIIQAITGGDIIDCGRLSPLSLSITQPVGAPTTTPVATATPPPTGISQPTFFFFLLGLILLLGGGSKFFNLKYGQN